MPPGRQVGGLPGWLSHDTPRAGGQEKGRRVPEAPRKLPPPCPASSHSASSMGRGRGYLQGQGGMECVVGGGWKASPRRCRLSR